MISDTVSAWCRFSGEDEALVREKMARGTELMRAEWEALRAERENFSPELFYRKSETLIYDLLWRAELMRREGWPAECVRRLEQFGVKRVLDFGCGAGAMGVALAERGFEVTLADIPGRHFPFLQSLSGGNLAVQSVEEVLAGEEVWEGIVCLEVLEHLPKPEECAAALTKHLAAGGILFASWSFGEDAGNPLHLPGRWNNNSFQKFAELELGLQWLNPGPCWARVMQKH
jgi:SAM-dependent methyltransferase